VNLTKADNIEYTIETQPMNSSVERTFDDIIWLRDQIKKNFPAMIVPILQKAKWKSKLTQKAIDKRLAWVQNFFDKVKESKVVRSSEFFIDFLSTTDKGLFEKKKKDSSKVENPKSIAEIKHLEGKALIGITKTKISESNNMQAFCSSSHRFCNDLIEINKKTKDYMEKLAEAFSKEAEIYKKLTSVYAAVDVSIKNIGSALR